MKNQKNNKNKKNNENNWNFRMTDREREEEYFELLNSATAQYESETGENTGHAGIHFPELEGAVYTGYGCDEQEVSEYFEEAYAEYMDRMYCEEEYEKYLESQKKEEKKEEKTEAPRREAGRGYPVDEVTYVGYGCDEKEVSERDAEEYADYMDRMYWEEQHEAYVEAEAERLTTPQRGQSRFSSLIVGSYATPGAGQH